MIYVACENMLNCQNLGKYVSRTIMARLGVDYETVKQTAVKLLKPRDGSLRAKNTRSIGHW
jgi:hypothetical protein